MIQIDMPMPNNCDECRFNTEYGFCKAMPDNFCGNTDNRKRPEWCPLKEQDAVETKTGEWIYCEDASGQDGYRCSECGFFEPWYYDFENHNFITDYVYCPSCGKQMQERLVKE